MLEQVAEVEQARGDERDHERQRDLHAVHATPPARRRARVILPAMADFGETIGKAYATEGAAVELGTGVLDGELVPAAQVKVSLRMTNRHGLIAGATGTGKTRTLQAIAEQLSAAGVSVFVTDVKGDLSGLAGPATADGPAGKRAADLGIEFAPTGFPVEYLSLGGIGPGVPVRATVSDFGPQLLAKVLDANETQEQSLVLVFHYADQKGLPLLDLSDLRALLTFLDSDAGKAELEGIGGLSSQTVGVLLRSLVGLETGGGNEFFGDPQFDVHDLLRTADDGRGVISCLELPAVQDKPKLFSTVLMWLLAELYEELPEAGDLDKPKLCFFFDEAHLLFTDASKAFLESVVQTVRLIRSKGVGVYFITQVPKDVDDDVLAQLGNRVQHALRAFTEDDAKALAAAARTYPEVGVLRHRAAAPAARDRRGGGHDPVRERRADAGRAHAAAAAASRGCRRPTTSTRPRRRRRSTRSTASASTRRARASCWPRASRSRPPRRNRRPRPAEDEEPPHKKAAKATGGGADGIGDFLNSSAASRSSARSCAASSGC